MELHLASGVFSMNKLIGLLFVFFCNACSAFECAGQYERKESKSSGNWEWMYKNGSSIVKGESLVHPEHDSFSIIGGENPQCIDNNSCSAIDVQCAAVMSLKDMSKHQLAIGRIQFNGYGIYEKLVNADLSSATECGEAYVSYMDGIEKVWKETLSLSETNYHLIKLNPREIHISKPESISNSCFPSLGKIPKPWKDIDFFPVVKAKLENTAL